MGKDIECAVETEQSQEPAVAEATRDRAPPIRVLINNKEYISKQSDLDTYSLAAIASETRHGEFSDCDLPVNLGKDTTVFGDKEQQSMLPVIASVGEPVVMKLSDDNLPNQVADPEAVGREAKEKARKAKEKYCEEMKKELSDPKLLDVLSRLINLPNRENFRTNLCALDGGSQDGKQCGGGTTSSKGSQTESSSAQGGQGGFVTGYTGARSSLVVGGLQGGGVGGAGGGDDEDPNNYRPYEIPPAHYTDFMGFEEQPEKEGDAERNAAMAILTQGLMDGDNPLLSQFNNTHEEPLSASLEGVRPLDLMEGMDLDFYDPFSDAAQYLGSQDPIYQVAPAEETATLGGAQPVSNAVPTTEDASSDIKASLELIHMMKPSSQPSRPQAPMIGITLKSSSIPRSAFPGLNSTYLTPLPSLPSPASSNMSVASPCPPLTPKTPAPPQSPAPTPTTPQPRGFFLPKSYVEEDSRVCELSIAPDIPPDKLAMASRAMLYINEFYTSVFNCSQMDMDLKVANDVHANLCCMQMDNTLKVSLRMPKDCKPLSQWLKQNSDLKDCLTVLQQILNTLSRIQTLGYENNLTLWGSFMVWVAEDMRVYLLVDFPMLLQRQEMALNNGQMNPRMLDVMKVQEIYTKMVVPCIGRDGSWVSPALRSALQSFENFLGDPHSSCRMAEAARMLGEKRVCKVDVEMVVGLSVVFYCLEREELHTALRDLSHIAPSRISNLWMVQSVNTGTYMRVGDIATADRQMRLRLVECTHCEDHRLLYIVCNDVSTF